MIAEFVVTSIICKSFFIFLTFYFIKFCYLLNICYLLTLLAISVHVLVISVHLIGDICSFCLLSVYLFCYLFTSYVIHSPYIYIYIY